MTTYFAHGKFWVVNSTTFALVETFPPFETWKEAREAIGDSWADADLI